MCVGKLRMFALKIKPYVGFTLKLRLVYIITLTSNKEIINFIKKLLWKIELKC